MMTAMMKTTHYNDDAIEPNKEKRCSVEEENKDSKRWEETGGEGNLQHKLDDCYGRPPFSAQKLLALFIFSLIV